MYIIFSCCYSKTSILREQLGSIQTLYQKSDDAQNAPFRLIFLSLFCDVTQRVWPTARTKPSTIHFVQIRLTHLPEAYFFPDLLFETPSAYNDLSTCLRAMNLPFLLRQTYGTHLMLTSLPDSHFKSTEACTPTSKSHLV
jgi:hypothetical protein